VLQMFLWPFQILSSIENKRLVPRLLPSEGSCQSEPMWEGDKKEDSFQAFGALAFVT
jgi:hypothetical protein